MLFCATSSDAHAPCFVLGGQAVAHASQERSACIFAAHLLYAKIRAAATVQVRPPIGYPQKKIGDACRSEMRLSGIRPGGCPQGRQRASARCFTWVRRSAPLKRREREKGQDDSLMTRFVKLPNWLFALKLLCEPSFASSPLALSRARGIGCAPLPCGGGLGVRPLSLAQTPNKLVDA